MNPNLFSFATSELSQDAFLCWLLSWADPEAGSGNELMHRIGTDFLLSLFQHAGAVVPEGIRNIEIHRQAGGVVDILCIVNDDTAILIEDKRGSQQHSGQLARYLEYIQEEGFPPEKILPLYIQTGDQADYTSVKNQGYKVVQRRDLLSVLESSIGKDAARKSDILADFTAHLRSVEDEVESFKHIQLSDWSWNAWQGFYKHLQKVLGEGGWDYVPNPSGGFLGFWWHFLGDEHCEQYLQLEMDKLCFKISVADKEQRSTLRNHWSDRVLAESAQYTVNMSRPKRFGSGTYMTVAILDHDYRAANEDGMIDLESTIQVLRSAQTALDAACSTKAVGLA